MTNDSFKSPCDSCGVAGEIIEAFEFGLCVDSMCDGCFYYEYGCTEDEFFCDDCEDSSHSDCGDCKYYYNCDYSSLDNGNKCVWSNED